MLTHTKPLPGAKSRELEELQLCPCCSLLPHALRFTQNLLPNDNPELMREKSKRLTHVETRWTKGEATALQRELESVNRPHEIPSRTWHPQPSRTPPRSQEPFRAAYTVLSPAPPPPPEVRSGGSTPGSVYRAVPSSPPPEVRSGGSTPGSVRRAVPSLHPPPAPPLGSWFRVTPPKGPLPRPSRLLHTLRERCDSRPSTHPLRSRARTTSPLPEPRSAIPRQVSASLSHRAQPPAVDSFGWHLEPSPPCDPGPRSRPRTWL